MPREKTSDVRQRYQNSDGKPSDKVATGTSRPRSNINTLLHRSLPFLGNCVRLAFNKPAHSIVILYLAWLVFSYALAALYRTTTTVLAPLCSIPILGSHVPTCAVSLRSSNRPVNARAVAASHNNLAIVADTVGQNHDLAQRMANNGNTVRDLKSRVAASNLPQKKELTKELETLIKNTKMTAKGLLRFTSKVSKSIDKIVVFDEYVMKCLEDINHRQRHPPTLPSRALSAITPFAAFAPAKTIHTKEQITDLFIRHALKISDKARLLLVAAHQLDHDLGSIQDTLDEILRISTEEFGSLPQHEILGALWVRLARPSEHREHQSHHTLLSELTTFYKQSSKVLGETINALNRVETDLEGFGDDYAKPALLLTANDTLDVVIGELRRAGQRLQAGEADLRRVEAGQKPRGSSMQRDVKVN